MEIIDTRQQSLYGVYPRGDYKNNIRDNEIEEDINEEIIRNEIEDIPVVYGPPTSPKENSINEEKIREDIEDESELYGPPRVFNKIDNKTKNTTVAANSVNSQTTGASNKTNINKTQVGTLSLITAYVVLLIIGAGALISKKVKKNYKVLTMLLILLLALIATLLYFIIFK